MDNGDLDRAMSGLSSIVEKTDFSKAYLLLAEAQNKAKKQNEALKTLDTLHKLDPGLGEKDELKGLVLRSLKKENEAKECFIRATTNNRKLILSWINLIEIHAQEGNFSEAMQYAKKGLKFNPDNPDLHFHMSLFLNKDESIRVLERTLRLDPNHIHALNELALILADRKETLYEAEIYARRAHKLAGNLPHIQDPWAGFWQSRGN